LTSAPAAKCCLMASMFPVSAAWVIEMSGALVEGGSGALAVGGSGFAGSATGSAGSTSGGGADCCDPPHPTSITGRLDIRIVARITEVRLIILSAFQVTQNTTVKPTTQSENTILPVDLSAEAAEFGTLTATNLFDRACEEIRWHLRDRIRISPRSSSASPRAFAGRLRRAAPFE